MSCDWSVWPNNLLIDCYENTSSRLRVSRITSVGKRELTTGGVWTHSVGEVGAGRQTKATVDSVSTCYYSFISVAYCMLVLILKLA